MKYILLLLCVVGLGLGGQCDSDAPVVDPKALKEAKDAAQNIANDALAKALEVKTKAAGTNVDVSWINELQTKAQEALKEAEEASTEEEANAAKDKAKKAYDNLASIYSAIGISGAGSETEEETADSYPDE